MPPKALEKLGYLQVTDKHSFSQRTVNKYKYILNTLLNKYVYVHWPGNGQDPLHFGNLKPDSVFCPVLQVPLKLIGSAYKVLTQCKRINYTLTKIVASI